MSSITLSRKQLFDLVWSEPFLSISKKYKISDTGLRKLCARIGIPYPRTGYWQRKRAGRRVDVPNFKNNLDIEKAVRLELRMPEPSPIYRESELERRQRE